MGKYLSLEGRYGKMFKTKLKKAASDHVKLKAEYKKAKKRVDPRYDKNGKRIPEFDANKQLKTFDNDKEFQSLIKELQDSYKELKQLKLEAFNLNKQSIKNLSKSLLTSEDKDLIVKEISKVPIQDIFNKLNKLIDKYADLKTKFIKFLVEHNKNLNEINNKANSNDKKTENKNYLLVSNNFYDFILDFKAVYLSLYVYIVYLINKNVEYSNLLIDENEMDMLLDKIGEDNLDKNLINEDVIEAADVGGEYIFSELDFSYDTKNLKKNDNSNNDLFRKKRKALNLVFQNNFQKKYDYCSSLEKNIFNANADICNNPGFFTRFISYVIDLVYTFTIKPVINIYQYDVWLKNLNEIGGSLNYLWPLFKAISKELALNLWKKILTFNVMITFFCDGLIRINKKIGKKTEVQETLRKIHDPERTWYNKLVLAFEKTPNGYLIEWSKETAGVKKVGIFFLNILTGALSGVYLFFKAVFFLVSLIIIFGLWMVSSILKLVFWVIISLLLLVGIALFYLAEVLNILIDTLFLDAKNQKGFSEYSLNMHKSFEKFRKSELSKNLKDIIINDIIGDNGDNFDIENMFKNGNFNKNIKEQIKKKFENEPHKFSAKLFILAFGVFCFGFASVNSLCISIITLFSFILINKIGIPMVIEGAKLSNNGGKLSNNGGKFIDWVQSKEHATIKKTVDKINDNDITVSYVMRYGDDDDNVNNSQTFQDGICYLLKEYIISLKEFNMR